MNLYLVIIIICIFYINKTYSSCSYSSDCSQKPEPGLCKGPESRSLEKRKSCKTIQNRKCTPGSFGNIKFENSQSISLNNSGINVFCYFDVRKRRETCNYFLKDLNIITTECNLNEYCNEKRECISSLSSSKYKKFCSINKIYDYKGKKLPILTVDGLYCIDGKYQICREGEIKYSFDGSISICSSGLIKLKGTSKNIFDTTQNTEDEIGFQIFCTIIIVIISIEIIWDNLVNLANFIKKFHLF